MMKEPFTNPQAALAFIFAGNARFTLVSKKTGKRYTFRVRRRAYHLWYASVLVGNGEYATVAYCNGTGPFVKTRLPNRAVNALRWTVSHLRYKNVIPADLEIWHEGRCGKCARPLTVPASIASGFGPGCAKLRNAA